VLTRIPSSCIAIGVTPLADYTAKTGGRYLGWSYDYAGAELTDVRKGGPSPSPSGSSLPQTTTALGTTLSIYQTSYLAGIFLSGIPDAQTLLLTPVRMFVYSCIIQTVNLVPTTGEECSSSLLAMVTLVRDVTTYRRETLVQLGLLALSSSTFPLTADNS
jgi:hypothetical protein